MEIAGANGHAFELMAKPVAIKQLLMKVASMAQTLGTHSETEADLIR
jgi:hypothetical protein